MDHDALSKSLFALPQVEADVLRIVAAGWVHLLDLDTLERLSAEHPSADLTLRAGDLAWRVRFRVGRLADGKRPWLLSPTELQSTHDSSMAERQFEYTGRHIRALRREGVVAREGEEPRVLPVVVYSGSGRWPRRPALAEAPPGFLQPGGYVLLDAAAGPLEDWPQPNRVSSWARLLRSDNPGGLRSALRAGLEAFSGRGDAAYRNSLRAWALALVRARMPGGGDVPLPEIDDGQGESEMTTLLEANFEKWEARVMERGVAQGMERGIAQGVEQGRSEERERLRELARQLDPETAAKVSELLDQGE
ncbi:MAG: Rpn family recombination-promoting nuclease/putative transposase [Gammaproteobacteria bacterium]|nr:Rpn family recombination-promoting nuclease/putative transposase [Gammaproteobacteria bacterium]